ncbi:zinc finger, CCHC-type containing protein [Tanacetum coccineum]
MASSITRFDIEKFDGNNEFGLWQIKMRALMVQQGCDAALETLPVDMKTDIVVWEGSLTMKDVLATLNPKELKKRTEGTKEEAGDGLYVRGRSDHSGKAYSKGSSQFKSRGGTGKLKCFICHSEGHLKRDFPMKKSCGLVKKGKRDQDYDSSDDEGNAYFGEALVVVGNDKMTELVMDSGGSYHMTHMRDLLYDFKVVDSGSVRLGDNRTCTIKGTGKVKIQLHNGSSFILEDVRYVPGLRRSLISLSTLEKEGYTVNMHMGRIKVIKGCRVMMIEIRKKNCMYTLEAKVMTFGVQNHGGSKQVGLKQLGSKQVRFKQLGHKQVGFKQLGLDVKTGVHEVQDVKHVWFEVELQGAQGDREAEVFQVSNDDAAVAQRQLEEKKLEEKTNTDCLVKDTMPGRQGGPQFEVPAQEKDAEYRLCLSVTPKIEDEDQALMLLTSLSSSYENFMETLLYGRESLTIEDVLATLNSRELKKRTECTKEEARDGLYVRGRSGHSGKAHFGGSLRFKLRGETGKLKCFICHSESHLKRDCLKKKSSRRDFLYDFKVVDRGSVQLGVNRTCTIKETGKVKIQLHDGSSFILDVRSPWRQDEKRVWFEVELQRAQRDRKAKVFQVSNDDAAVAQRRLEDKQLEEKTNTDCLVKEQEKVHLGIMVRANIMVTGVHVQEGAEGYVAEKKKVKESMKANLGKLLKYNAWSTRSSPFEHMHFLKLLENKVESMMILENNWSREALENKLESMKILENKLESLKLQENQPGDGLVYTTLAELHLQIHKDTQKLHMAPSSPYHIDSSVERLMHNDNTLTHTLNV